jgi:hypothetical protein
MTVIFAICVQKYKNYVTFVSNSFKIFPSTLIVLYTDTSRHEPVSQRLLILPQQADRRFDMLADGDGGAADTEIPPKTE